MNEEPEVNPPQSNLESPSTPPKELSFSDSSPKTRLSRSERRRLLTLRMQNQGEKNQLETFSPFLYLQNFSNSNWLPEGKWTWPIILTLMILIPGGLATFAFASLFRLPSSQSCAKVFWPTASASLRLYCAELTASKQTIDDLLKAIDQIKDFPKDHPLRHEVDRDIKRWSEEILNIGEATFQEGKIAEALRIAEQIPETISTYGSIQRKAKEWQSIWDKSEKIYQTAEDYLKRERWRQAFHEATLLLDVNNRYWSTFKYEQLTQRIQTVKTQGGKLAEARSLAESGGIDNLIKAMKLAQSIPTNSDLAEVASQDIKNFSKKILDLAYSLLEEGKGQQALDAVNNLPDEASYQEEIKDFTLLAQSYSEAEKGSISSLETAISQVKKITENRPLYSKSQEIVSRWQQEITDVKTLENARRVAQTGGVGDLKMAIRQVQTIPNSNPRGREAQTELEKWTRQVEYLEDHPFLQRAEQFALQGTSVALEAAIREAKKIGAGRSLYQQAQNRIQTWTEQSQKFQDQPYLDQADQLAANGSFSSAIAAAERIGSGRSLYGEARRKIEKWQGLLNAEQNLQNARQASEIGTPDALQTAIILASKVPLSSPTRWKADEAINNWSQELLRIGLDEANTDIPKAINILQKIPAQTSAYQEAQSTIRSFQASLTPDPNPPVSDRISPSPTDVNSP